MSVSEAQEKFLRAIPRPSDLEVGDGSRTIELGGYLRPCQWPKGTHERTVARLVNGGYLRFRVWSARDAPVQLTEKGRKFLGYE